MKNLFLKDSIKNSKGFSIVELLVALALLLIALGLGYTLIDLARNSFERSEQRWIEQNEVVSISNVIYHSLTKAYYIEIFDDINNLPSGEDDSYYAYYVDASGNTILKAKNEDEITYETLPGENLSLVFSKATYVANEVTFEYDDLMNVSITSDDLGYNLTNQIHLDNMNRDLSVQGLSTGNVIMFQGRNVTSATTGSISSSWCFVATATYGSPDNPTVVLLRDFRDGVLLKSDMGTQVVNFYYKNSPPLARAIDNSPVLKLISRAVLFPVVGAVGLIMYPSLLIGVMVGMFMAFAATKKRIKPL